MLLNSVVIIMREFLEAALFFSILPALTRQFGFNLQWVLWSMVTGILGAYIYAMNIDIISDWFDGFGQEVINGIIPLGIYFLLVIFLLFLLRFMHGKPLARPVIVFLMTAISTLTIIHEGAEIFLYFISVTRSDFYIGAVIGMIIGASIGISIALLIYYFLTNFNPAWSTHISLFLLVLVAAGMVSQASISLIQADWLAAQLPVVDMSDWISEQSFTGQLLYAFFAYEATPTATQLSWYLAALLLPIILLTILQIKYVKEKKLPADGTEKY